MKRPRLAAVLLSLVMLSSCAAVTRTTALAPDLPSETGGVGRYQGGTVSTGEGLSEAAETEEAEETKDWRSSAGVPADAATSGGQTAESNENAQTGGSAGGRTDNGGSGQTTGTADGVP